MSRLWPGRPRPKHEARNRRGLPDTDPGEGPRGVQLRYQRPAGKWELQCATAAELRTLGLRRWRGAVGILWPTPVGRVPAGVVVCRACVEQRPRLATASRPPSDKARVLFSGGLADCAEANCFVHTRIPPEVLP